MSKKNSLALVYSLDQHGSGTKESAKTISIMTPGIMTLSITTPRITALTIMTFSINVKTSAENRNWARYADCHFAECHYANRTACIRHHYRKTTVLSCHRCLINTGVEKMNHI